MTTARSRTAEPGIAPVREGEQLPAACLPKRS
jgi:hypothetical protein